MPIKIGHASCDECKRIKNGTSGDQNGKEVCIRSWYSKPWKLVLRCRDSIKAEKMAAACEQACANPAIGYDQNQRNTLNTHAKQTGYDLSKITTPCECDCSSFMTVCAQAAGIPIPYNGTNAPTTSTLKTAFTQTGLFEVLTTSKYLTSDAYLKRGDILVAPGSHTVMALENGSKIQQATYALVFDASFYSARYPDLYHAFGTDADALFQHFLTYGMKEGRQGNALFHVTAYRNRYPDLQAAFGDDLPAYYQHYMTYGFAENRIASE